MRVLLPDLKRVSAALVLAVSSHAVHAQTLQTLATYQGEDQQQRLMEGAKKEGSLLFYTTFPIEYASQLIEPFKNKYGVVAVHYNRRMMFVRFIGTHREYDRIDARTI